MSAGHTPGPWFYRRGDEWSHSVVTHHGSLPDGSMNCWEVASINKRREPEHEFNARLIASAPDLLAERDRLKALNAELAAVLGTIVRDADGRRISGNLILDENSPVIIAARAVLAEQKGEAS